MSKRTRGTTAPLKEPAAASAASAASSSRPSRGRASAAATTSAAASSSSVAPAQTSATNERKRGRGSSETESRKRAKPAVKAEAKSDSASDEEDAEPAPAAARRRQPASRPPAAAAAAAAPAAAAPAAAAAEPGGEGGEVDNDAPASGDSSALRSWALQHLPGSSRKSPWPGHDDLAVDDKTYAYLSAVGVVPMTFGVKLPESNAHVLERYGFATPMAYGLGKSGWVGFKPSIDDMPTLRQIKKWVLESYHAQAKKTRIKQLEAAMRQ